MSLRISSPSGVDLIEQPPQAQTVASTPPVGGSVHVQCLLIQDGTLPVNYVTGTVYWNDGSLPIVYNGTTSGTITIDTSRNMQPGDYTVRVEAHNYRTPVWDTVSVNFQFKVKALTNASPEYPIVFGPILPKDDGYPNADQWSFNRGTNLEILASSVKMLLTTAKGERIMLPDYGTNLRIILFQLQSTGIEGLVQQEIIDALTKWEPRASLQFLTVERTGEREVTVNATLISKLDQQNFAIPLVFNA